MIDVMKNETLTKKQALELFGGGHGSARRLARAIGLTDGAVSQWPDGPLSERNSRLVRLTAERANKTKGAA